MYLENIRRESIAYRMRTLVQADYSNIKVPTNTHGSLWSKKESKQAKVSGPEQS